MTVSEVTYSVDDAVNKAGYGAFQIRLLLLTGLALAADGAELFILSIIGGYMACDWELHNWHIALLTSVVFIGIMIGSPVLGKVADIYGRKIAFATAVVLLFFFGVVSAVSPNYACMVLFRGCMGFAIGGINQGFTTCSEYSPQHMRGRANYFVCYFFSVGTIGVILLAWVVMKYLDNWRILLGTVSAPALFVIVAFKWYPESARFYLVSRQHEKATAVLDQMAAMNGATLPQGTLMEVKDNYERGRLRDLMGKQYRRTSLLFAYIWIASAFSFYGVALLTPIIIQHGNLISGGEKSSDVMLSSVPCLSFSEEFYVNLLWTSSSELAFMVIFTFLVERVSRKTLLSGACFISTALVFLLLLNTNKIVLYVILFGARGILCANFQLCFIMTTEAFPTTFKSLAMGVGSAFGRIGGIIVPYVSQMLVIGHPVLAICLIAVVLLMCGIAGLCLPFETRGVEMKEVHDQ